MAMYFFCGKFCNPRGKKSDTELVFGGEKKAVNDAHVDSPESSTIRAKEDDLMIITPQMQMEINYVRQPPMERETSKNPLEREIEKEKEEIICKASLASHNITRDIPLSSNRPSEKDTSIMTPYKNDNDTHIILKTKCQPQINHINRFEYIEKQKEISFNILQKNKTRMLGIEKKDQFQIDLSVHGCNAIKSIKIKKYGNKSIQSSSKSMETGIVSSKQNEPRKKKKSCSLPDMTNHQIIPVNTVSFGLERVSSMPKNLTIVHSINENISHKKEFEQDIRSCQNCEQIYLDCIMNDFPLKVTICKYCGHTLNQQSLNFYIHKYREEILANKKSKIKIFTEMQGHTACNNFSSKSLLETVMKKERANDSKYSFQRESCLLFNKGKITNSESTAVKKKMMTLPVLFPRYSDMTSSLASSASMKQKQSTLSMSSQRTKASISNEIHKCITLKKKKEMALIIPSMITVMPNGSLKVKKNVSYGTSSFYKKL